MSKLIILLLSILPISIFYGCGNKEEASSDFKSEISFDGSSSLAPIIASIGNKFMEEYGTWDKVNTNLPNEKISIFIASAGSGAGVKSIMDNTANFGMLARKMRDSEKERMENSYRKNKR